MGIVSNSKLQKPVFNGKPVGGAVYNGKLVYSPRGNPVGVPSTARLALLKLIRMTNLTGRIHQNISEHLTIRGARGEIILNLDLLIERDLTGGYSLNLGLFTGDVPIAGSILTSTNTIFAMTGIEEIYILIDNQLWAMFNMNARGDVVTADPNVPAAPVGLDGTKATEMYDRLKMYSFTGTGRLVATFEAFYNALIANVGDGVTKDIKVEIYWN